jgi:hypothetical protein
MNRGPSPPIRVSKGGDGAATDKFMNGNGLSGLVIKKINFRETHNHRRSIANFKFGLNTTADDLFRRNTVSLLDPGPHKFNAPSRDNERLEVMGPKIFQQFKHGLVDEIGEGKLEAWMLGCGKPVFHNLLKFCRGHTGVGSHDELYQPFFTGISQCRYVVSQDRLEGHPGLPLRVLPCQFFDAIDSKKQLEVSRLFRP